METKTLTVEEAAQVMCEAKQVAFIHNNDYMFVVKDDNYIFVNQEMSELALCAIIISIRALGDGQTRYIYFAHDDEVEILDDGVVIVPNDTYDKIIDTIEERYPEFLSSLDNELGSNVGLFPIQPKFGSQYAGAGIELYKLEIK